ncbi:hypothetical protein EXIGLDRAFT_733178 [Exidia glandulosa HHB12029]|uniref:SWI/SNF and RSC complexes subunit Ssr4 N-terminal domain-containing protein n=1 Tax=Exidia glandulosa HHB12029 TaxID=1314781 RepID=A0A165KKY5_EXIGL|nr:hypothetical protein EXIGLDRAFT_733178 [Exidia glandulosa HHB12029]
MAYQQGGYGGAQVPQESTGPQYCLKYTGELHSNPQIEISFITNLLKRGVQVAASQPFYWGYIDKPEEGQMFLAFLMPQAPGVPQDGIRYLEKDVKYPIPSGPDTEVEVIEVKHGYIPGVDQIAQRARRVYRLLRGGHPNLMLIHYSRGPAVQVSPHLLNVPVRQYPLRPLNEPPVIPLAPQQSAHAASRAPGPAQPPVPAPAARQAHAQLQVQNAELEARERARIMAANSAIRLPEPDYDDEDESTTHISARSLALMRFKRNHALMNEVFNNAAKLETPPASSLDPAGGFKKDEIDAAAAKLEKEIEALQARTDTRRAGRKALDDETMAVDEVPVV